MADQASRFTSKEVEHMANILLSLKDGELKVSCTPLALGRLADRIQNEMIDIPKFAKKSGVAEGSARNILGKLRRKIAEQAEADDNSAPSTPAQAKPKKTQAKKASGSRRKVAEVVKSEEDSEEGGKE